MSGLAEQRLIIRELEQATAINRGRLVEACRSIDAPADAAMIAAGTALIVADVTPGIAAIAGLFSSNQQAGERRERLLKVVLEIPLLMRSVRRLNYNQRNSLHAVPFE